MEHECCNSSCESLGRFDKSIDRGELHAKNDLEKAVEGGFTTQDAEVQYLQGQIDAFEYVRGHWRESKGGGRSKVETGDNGVQVDS